LEVQLNFQDSEYVTVRNGFFSQLLYMLNNLEISAWVWYILQAVFHRDDGFKSNSKDRDYLYLSSQRKRMKVK